MTKCRCYDGPYSSMTPRVLVSVRCEEHHEVPSKPGHSLMLLDKNGKTIEHVSREKATAAEKRMVSNLKRAKSYKTAKKVKK